jgi:hypothetical protein
MLNHSTAFDFCMQQGDYAGAILMCKIMNTDLPVENRVVVGHGINKQSLPENPTESDLGGAELIDPSCEQCKQSVALVDMHPLTDFTLLYEKIHRKSILFEWLAEYSTLVETRISEQGHKNGWWSNE